MVFAGQRIYLTQCTIPVQYGAAVVERVTTCQLSPRPSLGKSVSLVAHGALSASCRNQVDPGDLRTQRQALPEDLPAQYQAEVIEDYFADTRSAIAQGTWVEPGTEATSGDVTFREYANGWLARGVEREDIRPTTEDKYRGLLTRHLFPTFGDLELSDITEEQVEVWLYKLKAQHKSTAGGVYRLLATIFNSAKKLTDSPCAIDGASREPSRKKQSATKEECQAAIDAVPDEYRCAIMLTAWAACE